MATDTRLFPVTVYPDTALRALLRSHAIAVAGAVFCVYVAGVSETIPSQLILIAAALMSAVVLFGPFRRSRFLEFIRCAEFHFGRHSETDAVKPLGPVWLAIILILVQVVPIAPITRALILYSLLGLWFFYLAKKYHSRSDILFRSHWRATFTFLAYPDRRYSAPGGTAAIWIPAWSMLRRRCHFALRLLPFYLSLIAGSGMHTVRGNVARGSFGDAILLLPIPELAIIALSLKQLCSLLANAKMLDDANASDWEKSVALLRQPGVVNGVPLSEHLFLGWILPTRECATHPLHSVKKFDLPCRTPALVHDSATDGHVLFVGPTGFSKTTIGQAGIAMQVTRGHTIPSVGTNGKPIVGLDGDPVFEESAFAPMMAVDLKGDPALFNTFKEECERRGQSFRAFTLEARKSTSFFNPLSNLRSPGRPVIEFCEVVLNALDLWHGQFFYGGGYYSEQCRNLLLKALKVSKELPNKWEELYATLTETLDRREHRDVFELLGRIYALAQYPALGPAPVGIDVIHMPDVIANNECVYFWLPALASAMSVVAIAKMAILTYLDAARAWNTSGKPIKKSWLFMDEAQVVCGQNMERIFQQASGAKIRLVFSNQSLATLDSRDAPQLSGTMWTNTRVKQAFGLVDPRERENWIALSGEQMSFIPGYSYGTDGEGRRTSSESFQGVVHPRLNHNAINAVNNTPGASLLYLTRDAGLSSYDASPCQLWCPYPMTEQEYKRRLSTAWAEISELHVQNHAVQSTVVNTQGPPQIEAAAADKYAAIEEFFKQVSKQSGRRLPVEAGDVA